MKKRFPVFFLPLLVSCNPTPEKKDTSIPLFHYADCSLTLTDGSEDTLLNRYSSEDFEDALSKKESFPLFVFASGCGTCDTFSYLLKDMVKDHSLVLPFMFLSDYHNLKGSLDISDTSFVFYQNGKAIDYQSDLSSFEKGKDIYSYLLTYCYDTKTYKEEAIEVDSNLRTPYNFYSFLGRTTLSKEEKENAFYRYKPLEKSSKTYLFYSSKKTDYSSFSLYFKNHNIDALVDIENETDSDSFSKNYLLNLKDISSSPYTSVTYSTDGSSVSSKTELETLA